MNATTHNFSFRRRKTGGFIAVFLVFSYLPAGCQTRDDLPKKIDAKGIYYPPDAVEQSLLESVTTTKLKKSEVITQTTIEKKSILIEQPILNANDNFFESVGLNITLRAQVILYEQKSKGVAGLCYSKSSLSLPSSMIQNVYLYGRQLSGLSQLKDESRILSFQSTIPKDFTQNLESALKWCWQYVFHIDEKDLIAGYSSVFASLAINVPAQICSPAPSKQRAHAGDCLGWYRSLPRQFTEGSVSVCTSHSNNASLGQCEIRSVENGRCPFLLNKKNQRASATPEISGLTSYTESDLKGEKLLFCQGEHYTCDQVGTYHFSRKGKMIADTYVCRN